MSQPQPPNPTLTMLRSIGNRFRRAGDGPDGGAPAPSTIGSSTNPGASAGPPTMTDSAASFASALLHGKRSDAPADADAPDLYYEDRPLGLSIASLEQVRGALRHLAGCANDHAAALVSSANAQRQLGAALSDAMRAPEPGNGGGAELGDLAVAASVRSGDENAPTAPHFAACLPAESVDAQTALGEALSNHAAVVVKLSHALTAPINDLSRSFEERYARKIVPLRRRYSDQKGQYLKCKRSADMADTDERRSYFEALADAAKPVWMRTSTELRTEAGVMTRLTAGKMALWSRSLAKQNERALAIAAANFADAFSRANQPAQAS